MADPENEPTTENRGDTVERRIRTELRDRNEPFGVPSRFGVGTLLVVTTAYGFLLSLLLAMNFDRRAIAWIVVFVSLVGVAQMLLFDSRRPRQASLLAGMVALPLLAMMSSFVHDGYSLPLSGLVCLLWFGAPAGYLAGGVVAGVFLVMDAVASYQMPAPKPPRLLDSFETDAD